MSKQKWPKTIYITREGDGEDEYLSASEGLPQPEATQAVAIYDLREVGAVEVKREFKAE